MPNPTILWAQDRDIVYVTIQVLEIKEHDIKFENKKVIFAGKNNINDYNVELDLFTDIDTNNSNFAIYTTGIKLKLKKNHSLFWPRLTKTKQNNIKIDWSKWVNEDDSDDDTDENTNLLPGGHSFEDFKKQIPSEILEKDFGELFGGENAENNGEITDEEEDHSLSGNDASGEYSVSENSVSENNLQQEKLNIQENNSDNVNTVLNTLDINELDENELNNDMNDTLGSIETTDGGVNLEDEAINISNIELSDDIEELESNLSE